MKIGFEGFREIELTPRLEDHRGEVYVLVFIKGGVEVPFYVGQTTRFHGRMDDYFWASFQAPTDFKVGIAIQYFCSKLKGRVVAKHKQVDNPRAEEKAWIEDLKQAWMLLNGPSHDYKTERPEIVTEEIHSKCREIAAHAERLKNNQD